MLLLAWHFSLQAAAHDKARQQVRLWMQSMGASVESVQFRMLRGALTIHNIKVPVQGNPLFIKRLSLKGNPASIVSDKPLLQQVVIQQLSLDASHASQSWQNLSLSMPPSLQNIFNHAKFITVEQANIQKTHHLPAILIESLHVSGPADARQITAHGFLGDAQNTWKMSYHLPQNKQMQTGEIASLYQDIQSQLKWSGLWGDKSFILSLQQSNPSLNTSLNVSTKQIKHQWHTYFDAADWPINTLDIQTNLTGKGHIIGTPNQWTLLSEQIQLSKTKLPLHDMFIAQVLAKDIKARSKTKRIAIKHLDITQALITLDSAADLLPQTPWTLNSSHINMHGLEATVLFQHSPFKVPALNGTAKLDASGLQFDLSNQVGSQQFWHIQSGINNSVHITTQHTPVLRLRSLLPEPIRQAATTLEGDAFIDLATHPLQQWATSGQVDIKNLSLASKNQNFKAQTLHFDIKRADINGIHQSSLLANRWFMQLPLTPRQAWSKHSQWDDWASIPWSIQNAQLFKGEVAVGNQQQTWFSDAQLHIQNWQDVRPANLTFQATFGLAPFLANIRLSPNQHQMMQWETIKLKTQHANLQALSSWLQVSSFPTVEKGHISLQIEAKRNKQQMAGRSQLEFNQFKVLSRQGQDDFLIQQTGQSGQRIVEQLSHKQKLKLNFPFEDKPDADWSSSFGQSLLKNIKLALSKVKTQKEAPPIQTKLLGSFRIHPKNWLSQNERSRLRKIITSAQQRRRWHIELTPDLGTADFTPEIQSEIYYTQTIIKRFMAKRGIKAENIYIISAQAKHKSTSSAGAIHINLVK